MLSRPRETVEQEQAKSALSSVRRILTSLFWLHETSVRTCGLSRGVMIAVLYCAGGTIYSHLGNEHAGKPKKIRLHVSEQDAAMVELVRGARVAASTTGGYAVASGQALELEG